MKKLFSGSIDVSLIKTSDIKEFTKKNGDKARYVNVTIFTDDAVDEFKNNGAISISPTKEQRETPGFKKVYLGNIKETWRDENTGGDNKIGTGSNNASGNDNGIGGSNEAAPPDDFFAPATVDDLPF